MLHRSRSRASAPRRFPGWACLLAATLVFKAFVPLLAATAADLQGKGVADICAVYGVRTVASSGPRHHDGAHAPHSGAHAHGIAAAAVGSEPSAPQQPADDAAHAQDHCALSGLSACAVFAASLWAVADWPEVDPSRRDAVVALAPQRDASARWLTLRVHAPPRAA